MEDPILRAPQQHKQPSRKGKRAWRKHVDITEIQAGLEEAREDIAKGGILSEKPSESLFTLDTTGSSGIQQAYNKIHKPLKSDKILAQRSTVHRVSNHKRADGTTDGVTQSPSKKQKPNRVNPHEYERLRQVAHGAQTINDIIVRDNEALFDPWTSQEHVPAQDDRFSYLEPQQPVQAPLTLREPPICLVAGAHETAAVPRPKPGSSYNPKFQDWDALLTTEGSKEVDAERRRREDARSEAERLDRVKAHQQEAEIEEGVQTEDESAWEGIDSDYDKADWLKRKRPERKTPKERKRAERRKEKKREEDTHRKLKEREKQEKRIQQIQSQVDRDAKLKLELKERDLQANNNNPGEADDTMLRRRRLGKNTVPEPPLELVLPDELQDSLRLLKPEGNLLRDRFRNIMVRGKLESRRPIQQPKKKRRTLTEKWTHKDFQIGV